MTRGNRIPRSLDPLAPSEGPDQQHDDEGLQHDHTHRDLQHPTRQLLSVPFPDALRDHPAAPAPTHATSTTSAPTQATSAQTTKQPAHSRHIPSRTPSSPLRLPRRLFATVLLSAVRHKRTRRDNSTGSHHPCPSFFTWLRRARRTRDALLHGHAQTLLIRNKRRDF